MKDEKRIIHLGIFIVLVISLIINFIYLVNYQKEELAKQKADATFHYSISFIPRYIEKINKNDKDKLSNIISVSILVSKASTIYSETSHYKENPKLNYALQNCMK
ncbi:hypothetical protein [uncultured Clostridium sp.]|uniref:hypothetical protein n=1 Tax=uncultured Clostridium sp. TaxID=59620 RepID=UPI0025FCE322|nr:hypothetical protein [uncultured Clostridium sp.]